MRKIQWVILLYLFSMLSRGAIASDLINKSCSSEAQPAAAVTIKKISGYYKDIADFSASFHIKIHDQAQLISDHLAANQGTFLELSALVSKLGKDILTEADAGVDAIFFAGLVNVLQGEKSKVPLILLQACTGFKDFDDRVVYLISEMKKRSPKLTEASQKLKQAGMTRVHALLSREDKPVLPGHTARCAYHEATEGLTLAEQAELTQAEQIYHREFLADLAICHGTGGLGTAYALPAKKCSDETLTAFEYTALAKYKGSSWPINNALFTENPEWVERCDAIIFYLEMALSKFPDYRGKVRRGANKDQAYLDGVVPGQDFVEKIFMSTSANPNWLWTGNTLLKIVSLHGKHIVDYGGFEGENEVLMRPRSKFRVVSKAFDASIGRYVIEYQELRN